MASGIDQSDGLSVLDDDVEVYLLKADCTIRVFRLLGTWVRSW